MIIYATRLPTGRDDVSIDGVDSVPLKRLLVGRNVSDAAAAISAGVAGSLRPTDLRRPFALSIVPDDGRDLDLERLRNSFFGGDLLLSLSASDPERDLDRVRRIRCDLDVKGDVEDDDIKYCNQSCCVRCFSTQQNFLLTSKQQTQWTTINLMMQTFMVYYYFKLL